MTSIQKRAACEEIVAQIQQAAQPLLHAGSLTPQHMAAIISEISALAARLRALPASS
jgi:hypothetical protein